MTIDNETRLSQEIGLSDGEKLELGLNLMNSMERPANDQLRILIFTATYFVLDGVTLTIRRLESHLRSTGAIVKVLSTIPDDIPVEQTRDLIVVPGIKIPQIAGYAMGLGLDENTLRLIENFNPNIIHFTVPDFVGLDGIRYCQRNNIAYIATWHSNYSEYLKYYYLEWILGAGLDRYLSGFFEQVPVIYVPTPFVRI
jgi:glycosyltransferase involved in cell wall biosynthesis